MQPYLNPQKNFFYFVAQAQKALKLKGGVKKALICMASFRDDP